MKKCRVHLTTNCSSNKCNSCLHIYYIVIIIIRNKVIKGIMYTCIVTCIIIIILYYIPLSLAEKVVHSL